MAKGRIKLKLKSLWSSSFLDFTCGALDAGASRTGPEIVAGPIPAG